MGDAAEQAQMFLTAQTNAQLTNLPTFSNDPKVDKYTATQWLQKVTTNRDGTTWTDAQTITYVRNAFRGELIDWFDSLKPLGINTAIWADIQARFEIDFEARPSTTSIVSKIPDIKQHEKESVNQYFNKAIRTMDEFNAKIDPQTFDIPDCVLSKME